MASSVNNIAATFSTFPENTKSSSSSNLQISTSWNPHATIPKSQKLSLLTLYGPPGPPRPALIPAVRPPMPRRTTRIGQKVPNGVSLSFLDGNDSVRTIGLSAICRGNGKRVAIVGASAAFSPASGRFVRAVVDAGLRRRWDSIAVVADNDVFVTKAWGRFLDVGENVAMFSDAGGQLAAAIGSCLGLGGPVSGRFCVCAVNGVITDVDFDHDDQN